MEHIDDKKTIRKLQKAREKKGYSYNMLVEATKEIGEPVAYSTISKVFGKDGENTSFNYINTLQPLVKILLDGDEEEDTTNLQSELKLKEKTIEKLNEKIAALHAQMESMREEETRRLNFLKTQIELKDRRMDENKQMIDRVMDRNDNKDRIISEKDRIIAELADENRRLEEDLRTILERCKKCINVQATNDGVNG